jgi:hypothetical protein
MFTLRNKLSYTNDHLFVNVEKYSQLCQFNKEYVQGGWSFVYFKRNVI